MEPQPASPVTVPLREPLLHREPVLVSVILVALVLGGFLTVGGAMQLASLPVGVWFTELVLFFGVPWVALQLDGVAPGRQTGLAAVTWKGLGLGFCLGAVNYVAWAVPLMGLSERLWPHWVVEFFSGTQLFRHLQGAELWAVVLGVGLGAPLGEELFFRGVLQRALFTRLPAPRAVVVTAILFSLFHLDPVGFLARFELGIVFGLLAWRSGSLWPSIGAHAANNLLASAIYFASRGQPDTEITPQVLVGTFVVGNALLWGLVWVASGRLQGHPPAAPTLGPRLGLVRAAGPWVAASLLALGLVTAFDANGVKLRLYESTHPFKDAGVDAESLESLRGRARAGEVPLQTYFDAYEELRTGAK